MIGMSKSSRFQDLSREQGCALAARTLQRMMPLLTVRDDGFQSKSIHNLQVYLTSYLEFSFQLAEFALGNVDPERARVSAREYYERLADPDVFEKKSELALDGPLIVADALGETNLFRFYEQPSLPERDRRNPHLFTLVANGAHTLSRIGMLPEIFVDAAEYDCGQLVQNGSSDVGPKFFNRPLWYDPPYALKHVIIDDWLTKLQQNGLGGLAQSYRSLQDGIHLKGSQRSEAAVPTTVTIHLGNGASWIGPLAVGQNIQQTVEAVKEVGQDELAERLNKLVKVASDLIKTLETEQQQLDASAQLKAFVEEAKKPQPSKWMLETSKDGLLKSATAVSSMVGAVAAAIKGVLALVGS